MSNESPDVFRTAPSRGAGIRRINRLPLMSVFGVVVLVLGVIGYTVMERADEAGAQRKESQKKPDPASAAGMFDDAPDAGLINAKEVPKPTPKPDPTPIVVDAKGIPQPRQPGDADAYTQEWQQYHQHQNQIRQAQVQAAVSALSASPQVVEFTQRANESSQATRSSLSLPTPPTPPDAGMLDRVSALAHQPAEQDPNNAMGKRNWLDSAPNPSNYLPTSRQPLISPYEVKTGTVIPGVMVGGINSDLPGQIIAQVRENVWDTATGRYLLIPQGARLVGTYDNQVTRGQSRVLVAWTRIVYPDGSNLDLGAMPGSDQGGYAGFHDKVDNHYWKVFGEAILLSLFSAGTQLSQADSKNSQSGYSSQQIMASSLGQQLGQSGMQLTQKNLSIQPKLEIRPGYRFNVMVTKDMVLTPWKSAR